MTPKASHHGVLTVPDDGNLPAAKRTLWRAKIRFLGGGFRDMQEMLFREIDDVQSAAETAQNLLAGSKASELAGAEIAAIERVGHLWN